MSQIRRTIAEVSRPGVDFAVIAASSYARKVGEVPKMLLWLLLLLGLDLVEIRKPNIAGGAGWEIRGRK